ncbi:MAG: acyl-CoA dehydrogenase C-terminal domain-containing protein, partial [Desulfobacterales bacterium]|nr:acyl-CoA dehydrogenase C-terminal domain-containing protein [Desulfobacterales bacterium]
LENALKRLGDLAMHMGATATSADFKVAFAHASPFLDVMGDIIMAWMLLWRAVAATANKGKKKKDNMFYDGQIKTARFFINQVLCATAGKLDAVKASDNAVVEMDDAAFGSK